MRASRRVAVALVFAGLLVAFVPVISLGDEEMVVVARPGVLFHKMGSADLRGHAYGKSMSEAVSAGYAPCPVCFAKATTSARPALAAGFATSPGLVKNSVIISPGRRDLNPYLQPFGLRPGVLHSGGGLGKGAVKDPYVLNQTMRIKPLLEQGAYGQRG